MPWGLLIVAALMLRVLVPQGYMLEQDGSGGIQVSLCNADGTWVIPMKDGHPGDDGQDEGRQACAFAGHSSPATPPDDAVSLPLPQLALAPYDAVRERALSPTSPRILPPARAPPTLV
ncbi:hypothetical protein GCM10009127_17790 [Alteraurantiacibacter aestuarii]